MHSRKFTYLKYFVAKLSKKEYPEAIEEVNIAINIKAPYMYL